MQESYTLITGASSGFGQSIAQRLAPSRKLLLAGRSVERLDAVRNSCHNPDNHLVWARDLSRLDGIGDELASLWAAKGITVDHFIHSAGTAGVQLARATDMAFARRLFNVNVFSAMVIIRSLVQKKANHGALRTITLISSIAVRVGASGYSVYAASKGAVNALAISLAIELAPAVRVNAVLPGIIDTPMTREFFADASFAALYPLGAGRPDDVADLVEFLVSDRARWITGQEIVVDGGRSVYSPVPAEVESKRQQIKSQQALSGAWPK